MANTSNIASTNRVAVITGASSGIGAATAKDLAAKGTTVVLLARRKAKLEALAAEIGPKSSIYEVDVTNRAAVDAAAKSILAKHGRVDIVVNNAGIMLPNPIETLRADQWQQQIDLNISGLMNVIGAFTPALVDAAAKHGVADLVNVSSIAGRNIFPYFAVYSGTKAFVSHMSITLRAELGPKGVRVSTIEPGIVSTELADHVDFAGAHQWLAGAKQQMEFLQPEDIAATIAFTVGAPKRVNLGQVTVMPTGQAS